MTVAVTRIYRSVEVTAADLDMTIQIQEVRGWEYVIAFPAVTEADELAGDSDGNAYGNTQGATATDVADNTTEYIPDNDDGYVIIFRKRSRR